MIRPRGTLSTRDIANMLGVSRSFVSRKARKENWPKVEMTARGGTANFFFIRQIPEPTRSKLMDLTPPPNINIEKSKPKADSKLDRAIDHIARANELLTQFKKAGYQKKEINRILSLAKQALRMPRDEK